MNSVNNDHTRGHGLNESVYSRPGEGYVGYGVTESNGFDLSDSNRPMCSYCGIMGEDCLGQCLVCSKWFCNSMGLTTSSHLVSHLVRSKHKEVCLHEESPLGATTLECYACNNKNVFMLGFLMVPVDTSTEESEQTVVLLCRQPCYGNVDSSLIEPHWDLDLWQPLIQERCFLDWLIGTPSPDPGDSRGITGNSIGLPVTSAHITRIENYWASHTSNPSGANEAAMALMNIGNLPGSSGISPFAALRTYPDTATYFRILQPLVDLEAMYDMKMKQAQVMRSVLLKWDSPHQGTYKALSATPATASRRRVVYFSLKSREELRLAVGDEVKIMVNTVGTHWIGSGHLIKLPNGLNDDVAVELKPSYTETIHYGAPPATISSGPILCDIDFVWKSISFDRMSAALELFDSPLVTKQGGVDSTLKPLLLHMDTQHAKEAKEEWDSPDERLACIYAPGLPRLNLSQQRAVATALVQPLSLIQGPPGTGKTVTTATLVYQFATNSHLHTYKTLAAKDRRLILVCAPSNIAVDQLALKINMTGLRVVRLCAKSREAIDSPAQHLSLHTQMQMLYPELNRYKRLKDDSGELTQADERNYKSLHAKAEREVLGAASVICTTCVGAGDHRLALLSFTAVLIDEATQATEPESLIPIARGAPQLVLVGDHRQLGPVVMCRIAAAAGLGSSLFERLVALGTKPIRLAVQYRMHPALAEFPSNTFYDGALQNGVSPQERTTAPLHNKPGKAGKAGVVTSRIDQQLGLLDLSHKGPKGRALNTMPGTEEQAVFPWPNRERPSMFWYTLGQEEISGSGTSYLNRAEASNVEKLVTRFLKTGLSPEQIGVVTPYEGQRAYIVQHLQTHGPLNTHLYVDVEVASVDAFQGREKDYIILTCVRSNQHQGIGFLSDARRLNVALTRAKYGIVVVGNPKVLMRQPVWNQLLASYKKHDCLVEGPLNNLKLSALQITSPEDQEHSGSSQNRLDPTAL